MTHFYRTAILIEIHHKDGSTSTVSRKDFEEWIDKHNRRIISWPNADCESTAEDQHFQTWDEYYSSYGVESDLKEYIVELAQMCGVDEMAIQALD